jgi:hypothetical protein
MYQKRNNSGPYLQHWEKQGKAVFPHVDVDLR